MKYLIAFLLLASPALADKALILSDQDQAALMAIFDAAIKAQGLNQISINAFVLSEKLRNAGTIADQKPPEPTKEGAK
jgi:hypothetical protein